MLSEIWPVMERCTVISKKEIFYFWPFGLASWLWGTIFIDRLNVESAQKTINETGETIRLKQVITVLKVKMNMQTGSIHFDSSKTNIFY